MAYDKGLFPEVWLNRYKLTPDALVPPGRTNGRRQQSQQPSASQGGNVVNFPNPFQQAVTSSRVVATPGFGPPAVGADGKLTSYYPRANWLDQSAAGESFFYGNQLYPAAPAAVFLPAIGAEVTVCSFAAPPGTEQQLQSLITQVVTGGWVDGSGSVVWRLEINGVPVPGYSAIIMQMNGVGARGDLTNRVVRVKESQTLALICRNVGLVTAPGVNPIIGILAGKTEPLSQGEVSQWA